MIKLSNVTFRYRNSSKPILSDLNFRLNQGEFVSLTGLNGSGKTTFAKLFNSEIIPDKGLVEIDGLSTTNINNSFSIRKTAGHVFQNPDSQIIFSTVEEELVFGCANIGFSREQISAKINQVLEKVNIKHLMNEKTLNLSAGQKQLIAFSSVLIMDPKYYICDESTSMLDTDNKENILNILLEFKNREKGILYITSDSDKPNIADRYLILKDGKLSDCRC